VSGSRQRLSARDYKNAGQRGGFDIARYQQFGIGLGVGLLVALGVFVFDHRAAPAVAEVAPKPRTGKAAASDAAATGETDDAAPQYDFYDMLPKYEVVVPEQDREVRRDLPSVRVEQPGVYFVQVGSYRDKAEAERLRSKLSKQGIDATIQRVAVDADVWHRVRIGPFRDLKQLNDTRSELRAADVDAIVIRVGD
jgi:cell division protein FtsN